MSQVLAMERPLARLRDLVELGKPRLSLLVLFTAAVGVWLAPAPPGFGTTAVFLVATSVLVAAANTLNCWIERELDARMHRTCERPLPARRLEPRTALVSGLVLAAVSLATLHAVTNPLTTALGAVALCSYVLVYTPLKRFTPLALPVGAIPGALPPLMGFTAATDSLALPGWFAFGILFFWQLPHFGAISLYLEEDFRRGGFRVLSVAVGPRATRRWIFALTVAMVVFSLFGQPLGIADAAYTLAAGLLGIAFLAIAALGLRRDAGATWATRTFLFTLLYLPLLITALVLDKV